MGKTDEERAETARREAAEAQAKADRDRELSRREARETASAQAENVIVHGPVQT